MNQSVKKLQSIDLQETSPLKLFVWRIRRGLRDMLGGKDVLDTAEKDAQTRSKVREIYLKVDDFMIKYLPGMVRETPREVALQRVHETLERDLGYHFSDVDEKKPWGAYYRIVDEEADRFLAEFFPGLDPIEARLGRKDLVLSPKILMVYPGQRLSWQYHNRRAERWRFLTVGGYHRSHSDEQGKPHMAKPDAIVQFATGERHRLIAPAETYTLVAEIWQHTDAEHPSEEADIIRLADDYNR
ncbi:hypothetical protein JNM87_02660 [Candidatus Saccharibacteria bacterium]|nr:hypothetical protein [Candidatus Saccharibacteria bacterium]